MNLLINWCEKIPNFLAMDDLDRREWLLTNGLGSFASGTVCDARTRTYHGWLIAALDPPCQRTLLLSHLEASLEIAGQVLALGTNFWVGGSIDPQGYRWLRSFSIDPVPTWVWSGKAHSSWQLTRQLVMPFGLVDAVAPATHSPASNSLDNTLPHFANRVLIRYIYTGSEVAVLRLRPLIGDRSFHDQQQAESDLDFSQLISPQQLLLQALHSGEAGTPWQLRWTQGQYHPDKVWYRNYYYPEETQRGLHDREDLFSPGYLTTILQPGESLTLEARVGWTDPTSITSQPLLFDRAISARQERIAHTLSDPELAISDERQALQHTLHRAADQFIVYQVATATTTILAGYPWFNERVRDTLIALPGLTLATKRYAIARQILANLGHYCNQGLLPSSFPEDGKPLYTSIDTSLWWIEALGLYLQVTQDWNFLAEQYPVVKQIYKAFTAGTLYNIRVDASDGLITWDDPAVALTWMDACIDGQPITPRRGKPVEVNALWYSALCWASQWSKQLEAKGLTTNPTSLSNQTRRFTQQAQKVQAGMQRFWHGEAGYLFDTIEPDDRTDARIRPNAVVALSLTHCAFTEDRARQVLQVARDRLLTPYGLRSLDPTALGYIGHFAGNLRHRELAYHQGSVWSWLLGTFVRAWHRFYDPQTDPLPIDWQPIIQHLDQQACLGSVSEIFDGNAPHNAQGAIAHAQAVAELLRSINPV
jgi:predicted glycogen debranching enzyme